MENLAKKPTILVLEPYYGGSHRTFLKGLEKNLPFHFIYLTLPARKWKWRMRLAAISFAHALSDYQPADLILCSTFIDVATFRALAPQWAKQVPIFTYFHENQFAYPVQVNDERDFHFALTNYTSALASDGLAFNSKYNLETFLKGVRDLLKKADDMKMPGTESMIREKSLVLHPGLDFSLFKSSRYSGIEGKKEAPVIVWNHRWEHDKNPGLFFETLFRMDEENLAFQLVVLGQSFQRCPDIFEKAREKLARRILHFGFCQSREEYVAWLQKGDIAVSTAEHEFFGLAIIEAVRAGCRPVLPCRLSYPELFPREYLYEGNALYPALIDAMRQRRLAEEKSVQLTDRFAWENLAGKYQEWLGTAH